MTNNLTDRGNLPQTQTSLPLPPGNFGLPILGQTIGFLTDPDFATKQQAKYGSIFKTRILGSPTVFMVGAEANQFLFANDNKYFVATWPPSTRALLGPASLATQTGSFHTSRRKLLSQAFQPRALASYVPTIERITANYLEKWQRAGSLTWYPELRDYTFDVASSLLVGTEDGSQMPLGKLFKEWCDGLFTIPLPLPWTKFGKALRCRRQLLSYIEQIVRQRQQSQDLGSDALGILLQAKDEEGNGLSLAELKDQILLLLFAGHETLTSAIASFCLLLAQHPQVMARAREEQQKLPRSQPLSLDDLKQMTYLDAVLKEVLRILPPVGGGFRETLQNCEFNGYQIPKGWTVLYQITQTHKLEELYPAPQNFDPERFAPENAADKQKLFGYVPFGGGLRECLGKEFARLEMKVFAAMLLRDYDWELLPDQDLSMAPIPTPHPRNLLKVKFRQLKS
ncbi:MAG: cytochrome P450 [Pseudanabaena sp. CRU_2_10]|nr:cytochrome P450 [Pseudanabaena sp. CRU_2_10]